MSKGFASSYRLTLLASVVFICLGGIGVRLVFLQVIDRAELMSRIDRARSQMIVESARRGDIVDSRGYTLATSRTLIVLGVDPQMLNPEDEGKWPELARLAGVPLGELTTLFQTKTRPAAPANPLVASPAQPSDVGLTVSLNTAPSVVEKPVDDTELEDTSDHLGNRPIRWAKISEQIEESTFDKIQALKIRGVYGNRIYRRAYPQGSIASHLVGFVNKEGDPVTGMERYADFYLRGRDGWREGERDGLRRELAQFRTREVPAFDGYNVMLSIDSTVQHIVEKELAEVARKYRPVKATIIVGDPRTGFILALANYPTFDPNEYNKLSKEEQGAMRNVAVADIYEPGSTFKIVAASAALNEGLVNPNTKFDCTIDRIDYNGKTRRLPGEDHRFTNSTSVAQIIALSSNRGAAQLAMLMGDQKFYEYARAFGFGQNTGFPVGGEVPGLMAPPEKWDGLTITRMPMGHSVAATALQMHEAMGVIASGGSLLKPQIIRRITDTSNETVYNFDRIEKHRAIKETTAKLMASLLQGVVTDGTGKRAAIPGYEVAGKTGSTQKIVDGRYSSNEHVASFVGFFPASNPQVAITVIIDGADGKVSGTYASGGTVAAPSFKNIGEQLIQYLDIKPPVPVGRPQLVMEGGRR